MMDSWAERTTEADRVRVFHGDSRAVLKAFPDAHFDSVVCDPPYALVSITKRFGAEGAAPAQVGASGAYARASAGFMGQKWDTGETAFAVEFWAEVFRVLKPGGHVIAFSGTRTYHRLAVAIEDAGFEIRDMVAWLYGAGFPKSHQMDRQRGLLTCGCDTLPYDHAEACQTIPERLLRPVSDADVSPPLDADDQRREVLQPGLSEQGASGAMQGAEPGEGGQGREERGMEGRGDASPPTRKLRQRPLRPVSARPSPDGEEGRLHNGTSAGDGPVGGAMPDQNGDGASHRPQAAEQPALQSGTVAGQPESQAGGAWPICGGCGKPRVVSGLGTALKPALEPVVLARKPLGKNTVAANVLQHGTGALNIDASRVGLREERELNRAGSIGYGGSEPQGVVTDGGKGRWPANVIHDGSEEVVGAFPETAPSTTGVRDPNGSMGYHGGASGLPGVVGGHNDSGSAARFFKSAETGADELLFWAAKSKLAAWNSDLANTVDSLTRLSNQAVASALSDALTWALPVTVTRSPEPSMSATPSELNRLLTTAIMATQSFAGGPSPAPQPERLTPTGCLVSVAETSKPTDTTTITISRWKSDGSADAVTFSITQRKPEAGGLACQSGKRFWYSSKADASDRCGSKHPTVKPVDLMAYLVRMVTPPGGVTLDPFAGSGTTGVGAMREGMRCVLIEREDAYVEDIVRKLAWARGEGRLTTLEQAKLDTPEAQAKAGGADLPLFGDA
jgi:DNA modification methylase